MKIAVVGDSIQHIGDVVRHLRDRGIAVETCGALCVHAFGARISRLANNRRRKHAEEP